MPGLLMTQPTSRTPTRLSIDGSSMLELETAHKRMCAVAATGHETQRSVWTNTGTWLLEDALDPERSMVCIKRFGPIRGVSVRCRVELRPRGRRGLMVRGTGHIPLFVWLVPLAMFTLFFGSRLWNRHWSLQMAIEGLILGVCYAFIFFSARRTLKNLMRELMDAVGLER